MGFRVSTSEARAGIALLGLAAWLYSPAAAADEDSAYVLGTAGLFLAGTAPAVFAIHQASEGHNVSLAVGIPEAVLGYATAGTSLGFAMVASQGDMDGVDDEGERALSAILLVPAVMGATATCHGVGSIMSSTDEAEFDPATTTGMCAIIGMNTMFTSLGMVHALIGDHVVPREMAIVQGIFANAGIAGSIVGGVLTEESTPGWVALGAWSALTGLHAGISAAVQSGDDDMPVAKRADPPRLTIVPNVGAQSWGVTLGGPL
jgi:hypothetical protein